MCLQVDFQRILMMSTKLCMPNFGRKGNRQKEKLDLLHKMGLVLIGMKC